VTSEVSGRFLGTRIRVVDQQRVDLLAVPVARSQVQTIDSVKRLEETGDKLAVDAVAAKEIRRPKSSHDNPFRRADDHRAIRADVERRQEHEEAESVVKLTEGKRAHEGILTGRRRDE
jgi:hypothetical protein